MGKKPTAPDLATVLIFAEKHGLSIDWLLFGKGPEMLNATRPLADLSSELHAFLVGACATGYLEGYKSEVSRMLPATDQLLAILTQKMRELLDQELRERAKWVYRASVESVGFVLGAQDESEPLVEFTISSVASLLRGVPEPGEPGFLDGLLKDGDEVPDNVGTDAIRDQLRAFVAEHGKGENLQYHGARLQFMLDLLNQAKNDKQRPFGLLPPASIEVPTHLMRGIARRRG